ncbi:hypothetical protein NPX13_g4602 [Xylaria arbuscula]|uniref:2EXR domain-containing protein n=1 Tax=Xylaria arbuscula TaxID=114810 RepID=A0A9W8NFJ5_9PEZI|nr:hypothetical protein NPX13_g4602 [Xylaria arbuscula]
MDYSSLTFHLFPKLPPELRNKIWHNALPNDLKLGFYTYKKGLWPFVNREAHGIALHWAEAQNPQVRTCIEEGQLVFLRRFIPNRDALFVRDWDAIFRDAADEMFAPELLDQLMTVWPGVMKIAMTKLLLQARHADLSDLFHENWHSVRALCILVDMPQEQDISTENTAGMHKPLLECESIYRVALWTGSDWDFDLLFPTWGGSDARQLVELVSQGLRAGLEEWNVYKFEIFLCTCTVGPWLRKE